MKCGCSGENEKCSCEEAEKSFFSGVKYVKQGCSSKSDSVLTIYECICTTKYHAVLEPYRSGYPFAPFVVKNDDRHKFKEYTPTITITPREVIVGAIMKHGGLSEFDRDAVEDETEAILKQLKRYFSLEYKGW